MWAKIVMFTKEVAMFLKDRRYRFEIERTVFITVKDVIEEKMFERRWNLFTGLDLVFFDTTSLYFEGDGGETIEEFQALGVALPPAIRTP